MFLLKLHKTSFLQGNNRIPDAERREGEHEEQGLNNREPHQILQFEVEPYRYLFFGMHTGTENVISVFYRDSGTKTDNFNDMLMAVLQ